MIQLIIGIIIGVAIVFILLIIIGIYAHYETKKQMDYEQAKRKRNELDYSERNQHLNKK